MPRRLAPVASAPTDKASSARSASLADVAAVLEIPLGTAKSRLAYGLKALRRHLSDRRSP